MKKVVALTIILTTILGVGQVQAKKKFITLGAGWVTGVYYPLAGAMSRIMYLYAPDFKLTVESSGASVANARLIRDKEVDMAILQNDIAYYAYTGTEVFKNEKPAKNMRGVLALHKETVHIVARKDASINSPADLKGKKVAVGPLGSGTEANARQILGVYGLTFKDIKAERLKASEAADFLKDGRIDAAFFTVGQGAAAIMDVSIITPIKIVPIDDAHFKMLKEKYPFYARDEIQPGVYKGVNSPVPTVAVKALLVARKGLSTSDVHKFLKVLFDHIDLLHKAHARAKSISLQTALEGMSIPLHPGAEEYYKEKGVLK